MQLHVAAHGDVGAFKIVLPELLVKRFIRIEGNACGSKVCVADCEINHRFVDLFCGTVVMHAILAFGVIDDPILVGIAARVVGDKKR
jgi:hypothetical protein